MDLLILLCIIVNFIGFCWNTKRVNDLYDDFLLLLDERWDNCE